MMKRQKLKGINFKYNKQEAIYTLMAFALNL